jgi:hypothetical protein
MSQILSCLADIIRAVQKLRVLHADIMQAVPKLRVLYGRVEDRVESLSWRACLLLAVGLGVCLLAVGGSAAWWYTRPMPPEVVRPAGKSPSIFEENGMTLAHTRHLSTGERLAALRGSRR